MPIGPLMIEHRLIERMVRLAKQELLEIEKTGEVNLQLVATAIDFFRTYADRCHHGKEEDILFRDLAAKPLSEEHRAIMDELIREHVFARETVGKLAAAKERYENNDENALKAIVEQIGILVDLYPKHIEKEDKHFFIPCMEYFSQQEKDEMLEEFWKFDRELIHGVYRNKVTQLEQEHA